MTGSKDISFNDIYFMTVSLTNDNGFQFQMTFHLMTNSLTNDS